MIAYTVLFGDYERLNDQPIAQSSESKFYCITDQKNLKSTTFEFIYVEPVILYDSPRSSRLPKILPHLFFPNEETSLYFDNSVLLLQQPEKIFEYLNESDSKIGFLKNLIYPHLIEEFAAVYQSSLDDPNRINEFLNYIFEYFPNLLNTSTYWGGIIARRHNDTEVIKAMENWWNLVLRFSRRDQLSLPLVMHQSQLTFIGREIELRQNNFFEWPVHENRNRNKYISEVQSKSLNPLLLKQQEVYKFKKDYEIEAHQHWLTTNNLQETQTRLMETELSLARAISKRTFVKKLLKLLLKNFKR